jgi:asparagine synthase (glutamine-hydrolysing)
MCGIAGVYNTYGEGVGGEVLRRMAGRIAHRGPDAERFYEEDGLGLAHRHLRIIDLSDAAIQPMPDESGGLQLIFNGEIYNYIELRPELEAKGHRFRSHSDSETILHAYEEWGPDCLPRFNGMFAFALWDSARKRLFVARDRVGVKPLYYFWDGRTFIFASEIKALLAHPLVPIEPSLPAVAQYMNAMYTEGEHTWFRGVRRLLPGHYALISPEGLCVRQWWDVPDHEEEPGERPASHYIRRTRELLESSVTLRLRSDVPLGAHLSGGIDSSAIVALISRALGAHGERLRTFSGAFNEGQAYDERRYIHLVSSRYNTHHHETIPTSADLPRLFSRLVWHMDEPAAGPGILLQWVVCELTRRGGVTVINGGQGGDEAWGGYFGYIPAYLRTLARQARSQPKLARELGGSMARLALGGETRGSLLRAARSGRRGRLEATGGLGPWAGARFGDLAWSSHEEGEPRPARRTPLATAQYNDLKWYLPALLQVEDRASMAFSLESRAPLLDYRIIEHAARVPSALKMRGLTTKWVLREAVRDLLPPEIYRRRDKMGMPTPTARWFRGDLFSWVEACLNEKPSGLLAAGYVREALVQHRSGARDRSNDLWKMLNVETWWRVFIEGQGQPDAGDV